jgi:hypothetical protein
MRRTIWQRAHPGIHEIMAPTLQRPLEDEYAPYYANYISQVPDGDVIRTLTKQIDETQALIKSIPEDRGGHRYAPDKWSIREVIGHLIDSERIFAYRALRFARADVNPLAGFDQDEYVRASGSDRRSLAELASEFEYVRRSTIAMLGSFDDLAAERRGKANNNEVSVRAIAWIIAGHERHHLRILRERYLTDI